MNTLSNAQIAVMKSPAAMEIIANEAYEAIASKCNTTADLVKDAVNNGNESALKMFAELVAIGINKVASIV